MFYYISLAKLIPLIFYVKTKGSSLFETKDHCNKTDLYILAEVLTYFC